jgi:murein DD-endopeptidase MepM/ murein hydrolase activator NlpD
MTLELDPANVFHAVSEGDSIRSWKEDVVLDFKVETVTFPVRGSLNESVLRAGEGIELAVKLLNVFKWDIDFQSESMSGDVCKVLFERRYADDRPSGYGRILCAIYDGKKTGRKVVVLFNNIYYDQKGVEIKKDLLRSPLSVIRVTSKFGVRLHPIRKEFHRHKGVDYGAPQGTQVWSIASGVVTFSGWKGDYGNLVCVRHENGRESRYGHLHRIHVRKGQRVKQTQRIGLVGRTGNATGPHLHFELLVSSKHVNPLAVRMVASVRSVPVPLKPRFETVAQQRLLHLQGIALDNSSVTAKATTFD